MKTSPEPSAWPIHPPSNRENDPVFLFLFTPPYSGSTALAHILNSAPASMILRSNGEGQWLVPGLCADDRWDPRKAIHWDSVRSVWLNQVQFVEELVGPIELVIEKSPPNLARSAQLLEHFPRHEIMVFNRNPYANCSSILYRQYPAEDQSEKERISILTDLANQWVERTQYAKAIIDEHDPLAFTYEEFCADVASTIHRVVTRIPSLRGIDPHRKVLVKDYAPQKISNQNQRQISRLTDRELAAIGEQLQSHENLLKDFGYTSDWKQAEAQGGARYSDL
ncbi:MAG: sulfotransferase [Verrucomicrobiales bacterium]